MRLISRGWILGLCCLLFIGLSSIQGQQVFHEQFTMEKGLNGNSCFHIFQDSKGFLWICTNLGLSRYDGTTFTHFGQKEGLNSSLIKAVSEDDQQRIWVLTIFDGLFVSHQGETGLTFSKSPLSKAIKPNSRELTDLKIDSNGICTLYSADREVTGIGSDSPPQIIRAPAGTLSHQPAKRKSFVGPQLPVSVLERIVGEDTIRISLPPIPPMFTPALYVDSTTVVYGNLRINLDEHGYQIDTLPGKVKALLQVEPHLLVLSTENGVWKYDLGTGDSAPLLKDINAFALLQDNQYNIWVGTRKNGLFKIPSHQVITYPLVTGMNSRLNYFATGTGSKSVCVFSDNQVFEKDETDATFRNTFALENANEQLGAILQVPNSSDKILISNQGYASIRTLAKTGLKKKIRFGLSNQIFRGIFRNEKLHVTGSQGVYIVDPETGKGGKLGPDSLMTQPHSMAIDDEGDLWFAGIGGLYAETETGIRQQMPFEGIITNLAFAKKQLIIGTRTRGLVIFNPETKVRTNLTTADGLNSNIIASIAVKDSLIYVASARGINVIALNPDGISISTPYIAAVIDYKPVLDLMIQGETLWICQSQGVLTYPLETRFPDALAPVQLQAIQLQGTTISADSNVFEHNQQELTIQWVAPNFIHQQDVRYAYRLLGTGADHWIKTASNEISFAALSPGNFEFQVKPLGANGSESALITSYAFSILPPFWQQWWFIGLCVVAGLVLVVAIIRIRGQQVENKEALKTELARLELKALKAQINPHFIYNAISSVQYYLVKNQPEEAQQYMQDFGDLIRKVLEHSDSSLVSLESELKLIQHYVELESRKFKGSGVCLEQEIDERLNPGKVRLPPALFQPYVENAIWHGLKNKEGKRQLVLRARKHQKSLTIEIEDNGVGRGAARSRSTTNHSGRSFGISIATERIKALNGSKSSDFVEIKDLMDPTGKALGTKVTLSIPYHEFQS